MAARLPVSSAPVAYELKAEYSSKIAVFYWPAGADSLHRLRPGEKITTIVSRNAGGAAYNAAEGLITGVSTTVFSDTVAGGFGNLTESSDFAYGATLFGDSHNGLPYSTVIGTSTALGETTSSGIFTQSYAVNLTVENNASEGMLSTTGVPARKGIAFRRVATVIDRFKSGAKESPVSFSLSNSTTLLGVAGNELILSGSTAGGRDSVFQLESAFLGFGSLSDADLMAITANPSVLVQAAVADTTAPTLTTPTATQTGNVTASGTVTTNEGNGTLYALASINATETAATVKASSNTQVVSSTGSKSVTFTGLTANTTYYAHYVHRDAAGNDSAVASSSAFTTAAGGDTTVPTQTGSIIASAITSTSYTLTWPAATDNVAVTGYEYSLDGGATYTTLGAVLTVNVAGRTPGATDATRVRAFDGAGNRSTPALSTTVTLATAATGTLTFAPLKNNTGTLLTSTTCTVYVYALSGSLVVTMVAQTVNASGVVALAHANVVAGTEYRCVIVLASGAEGMARAVAA